MVIDFHTYVQSQSFLERLRKRSDYPRIERVDGQEFILSGPGTARPVRPEQNDIDARLEAMTESGIDTQVLRLQQVSGVDAFDPAEGVEIAQAANEELGALARRLPGRFVPFATVTMRDPDAAVLELERAVTQLGHRGVGLSASCDGSMLDSARFEEVFATAARLQVPVFVLPNHPSSIDTAIEPFDWLSGALGFQVDLTVVALRLLCAGTLTRHPNLKIVLANLGGVFPFTVQRLDHFWERMNVGKRPMPERPSEALKRYVVTTGSGSALAIRLTAAVIGADRMVFGSDYPSCEFRASVEAVRQSGFGLPDVDAILGRNAQHLLGPHEPPL